MISVIIPTYNEEDVILKCLHSLEMQTGVDFEVIVVDDGSLDKTLQVLSELRIKNYELRILKQEHKGPGAGRNLGAKSANGDILVFVDADMTFDKHFLKMLVKPILSGKTKGTFSKDEMVSNWDKPLARAYSINEGWENKKRHPKNYPHLQKVFRAILKSEFDRVDGFIPGGYNDDWSLSEKLGYQATLAEKAIFFHKNPDNIAEIFKHAQWVGKRKYKFGLLGFVVGLIRSSLPISIIIGLVKAFFTGQPMFLIFKIVYDFGVFIGIINYMFTKKRIKIMIYFVLLISLVLRLMSINQSLWLDEATTALVAQMNLTDFFGKFMLADFHPPLYYLIIHYWTYIFGTSEVVLRLPSVIFGTLTVYLVYLLARETKQKWPIVPALFLATSGLHVYYSQEARMYSLAAMLVCWLVYVYLKKKWIIFSLILPLIFLTDYVSIIILPALFIYSFFFSKGDTKKFLYSLGPLVISFLIWLPTFYNQISNGLVVKENASSWWNILGPVTFKNIALIPIKFIIGRVSIDDKTVYNVIIAILLSLFGYLIIKAKNNLVWTWFIASLLLGICVSFFIPTLTYFRYLFILPAFYLLISENSNNFVIAFVLCINLLASSFYLLNSKFHRENWRQLAKIIGQDKIILPANSQKEALTYYGKQDNIVDYKQLTVDDRQIWLSRYVWNIFDPSDSTRKKLDDLGYNWSEEVSLNGVVFWKYTKQ